MAACSRAACRNPPTRSPASPPIDVDQWVQDLASRCARSGPPEVTLTFAQSLDGSITATRGQPLALSADETMVLTHRLRSFHKSIMVGVGTVVADNPSLTTRLVDGPSPQPVVLDSTLRCPLDCKLLTSVSCRRPLVIAAEGLFEPSRRMALEALGAEVHVCAAANGHVDVHQAVSYAASRYGSMMIEAGAAVIPSVLEPPARQLLTTMMLTISPMMIGGLSCVQRLLKPAPDGGAFERWKVEACGVLGGDVVVCCAGEDGKRGGPSRL